MKKPLVIGVTGGIGGGKSTLCRMMQENSFLVYNTDKEARRIQDEDLFVKKQIIALFGEDIYKNQTLNRVALGNIVFNNPILLAKLSELVHPAVRKDFFSWKKEHEKEDFLFVECAILYESSFSELVDKTILVTAPEKLRIERVVKRDKISEEQVLRRISLQMPEEEKKKRADIILDSTADDALKRNFETVLFELEKIKNELN